MDPEEGRAGVEVDVEGVGRGAEVDLRVLEASGGSVIRLGVWGLEYK